MTGAPKAGVLEITGEASTRRPTPLNRARFHHLYIHIPFCRHRCGYCDFNAYAGLDGLMKPYVDALLREFSWVASRLPFAPLETVYLGGGTPSLIPATEIGRILAEVRRRFGLARDAEVTLEANPASTDQDKLAIWRRAGVNRLSLGVQGFDRRSLAVLERRTDGELAATTVAQARDAGFANVNLDLIYGIPFQTLKAWDATLHRALELSPEHLSCYCLTFEEGTVLHARLRRGELPAVEGDAQWRFLEKCQFVLTGAGFHRYEISNWSRPGRESRHNLAYWSCRPCYGAGCGAHSYMRWFDGARRWWNVSRPTEYISAPSFEAGSEYLDPDRRAAEEVMLGLRTDSWTPVPGPLRGAIAGLADAALVEFDGERARPTIRGMDLHNQIALAVL
jgi:oxygen-independent coproporphyrinogen-3 oxidase